MATDATLFWQAPLDAALAELESSPEGLASAVAQERLRTSGPNDAAAVKRTPPWLQLLSKFRNPLVLILLFASGISAATGDVASFVIVAVMVVLSVVVDFVQEWRAQITLEALRVQVALKARALRDGAVVEAPVRDLVPGDVVQVSAGDVAPADARVLEARDFFVNQALLTGEPYPVEKHAVAEGVAGTEPNEAVNAVFAGTSVVSGEARLLVCRTGRSTSLGGIAQSLAREAPPTAFETGVQRFGILILRVIVVLVLLVLGESIYFHRPWLQSFLFALALAVGLTPELLPMILTVTLARGAQRMAKRQVMIKRLPAIHNLGAVDVFCTDKTGTLTEARIELAGHVDAQGREDERVFELAYLNSRFETGLKSPLDDAILAHDRSHLMEGWKKLDEVPFDFERRRVSVLVEKGRERVLVVKGAPEDVLHVCTQYRALAGKTHPMTAPARARIDKHFEGYGERGYRALAIAVRPEPKGRERAEVADETELTFMGFVLFRDPPKASAGEAVRALARDGVEIKIITGDNERVARHVCEQLKLKVGGVITGAQLEAMSEEALLGAVRRTNLFCRVNPQQKLRIINALKRRGGTVGYMGDSINDAPALHAADVGVSVESGVDVAKAAADVILLQQDLGVLHDGVMEGRRTVVNVNKYILMASSANFGNIISMALAGMLLPFLPLLPIQVLLTNLMYDLAQTGLPLDRVDDEAVKAPVHWDIRLIEGFMLIAGLVSSVFDFITFGVLLFVLKAGVDEFRTGWFVESLATECLMIFVVRTRRLFFRSIPSAVVALLAVGMTALAVALPFTPAKDWFHFTDLPGAFYVYVAIAVVAFLAAMEAVNRVFYARIVPALRRRRRRVHLFAGAFR